MASSIGNDYCNTILTTLTHQTGEQQRKGRKRKNTSADSHGESENAQPAAKRRHARFRRRSLGAAASTSASNVLPHSEAPSTSAPLSGSSDVGAIHQPGLSMPSISSSVSSAGESNSKAGLSDYTSDTQASSDCFPNPIDLDYYHLDSPATVSSNVLSPPTDAILVENGTADWPPKGNTTPHGGAVTDPLFDVVFGEKGRPSETSRTCYITPSYKQRCCPLPMLSWIDTIKMWNLMCRKDELAWLSRDPNMFDEHPGLQPRMRAILLDWLNEVCEVYKLHRETYYLAVDYIDRFLSRKKELKKTHLQLLGITALFIAAKVEEIYPPKIAEFAYVTDGACTEEDILCEELLILCELDWNVNPVTVMGWLGLYMQINVTNRAPDSQMRYLRSDAVVPSPKRKSSGPVQKECDENAGNPNQAAGKKSATTKTEDSFVYPQFSGMEFAHTAQLIDLCSLDVGLANFKYSVIAAAAISHTFDRKTATAVSGLSWEEIGPCAKWMEPYFQVICDENAVRPLTFLESNDPVKYSHGLKHICPNMVSDNSYMIQTHTTSLDMLDMVIIKIEQIESSARMGHLEASPAPIGIIESQDGILTPPASNRKSLEAVGGIISAVSSVPSEAIPIDGRTSNENAAGVWRSS